MPVRSLRREGRVGSMSGWDIVHTRTPHNVHMRISAQADYAVRAVPELAVRGVTVADIAADALPEPVRRPAAEPAAWENP